ncbi:MAG: hypothetical protein U9N57_15230 [Pseudomonadota bacterium]|nr:hypothetical protein [Pseudomonadota bacterium]
MHLHQSTQQATSHQHIPPFLKRQHPSMPSDIEALIAIEDPRVVNRLVNNLMYLFNIQDGDYLTFVLGQGQCTNNKEAIKYWVLATLEEKPVGQDDVLEHLVSQLKQQMMMEVYQ